MKTLFDIAPCLKIGLMIAENGYEDLQSCLQEEVEEASNKILELSKEIKTLEKQLLKEEKRAEKAIEKPVEKKSETKKEKSTKEEEKN